MSDRRATKNLPWDEWLTSFYGPVKHDDPDLHFAGPRGCDRSLLYGAFCMKSYSETGALTVLSLVEELEARGYDTTTIEFRIKRKTP